MRKYGCRIWDQDLRTICAESTLNDPATFAKSLRCVNRTRPNKEIMITMRDFES